MIIVIFRFVTCGVRNQATLVIGCSQANQEDFNYQLLWIYVGHCRIHVNKCAWSKHCLYDIVRLFHIISPQWSSIHRPKLLYYGICIIENNDSYLPCIMKNWYFGISTFIILLNIPYTKVQIVHSIYTNRQYYQLLYLYSPYIQTLTQLFESTQLTSWGPFLYGIYTLW